MDKSQQFKSVKIGHGAKIHAGFVSGEVKKGRLTIPVYRSLCNSGASTLAHSYHKPSITVVHGKIDCERCIEVMEQ